MVLVLSEYAYRMALRGMQESRYLLQGGELL